MKMDRIKKHIYLLQYLSTLDNCAQRRKVIESATAEQIITLSEIAYNILEGVFELSDSELSVLQRYKHILRKLASRQILTGDKKCAILRNSVAIKHLLQVFFNHCSDGGGRSSQTDFTATNTISATDSESGNDERNEETDISTDETTVSH